MEIVKLSLFPVMSYQPLHRRSYKTNVTLDTLNALDRATSTGSRVSQTGVSEVAGTLIAPSAEAGKEIGIINGWGISRYRFILETIDMASPNAISRSIYIGFTDHMEGVVIKSDRDVIFDPNMQFFVTSVHHLTDSNTNGFKKTTIDNSSQMFFKNSLTNTYDPANPEMTMRPTDVFEAQTVIPSMQRMGIVGANFIDRSATTVVGGMLSSRRNNAPGSYLFDTLKAYQNAHNAVREGGYASDDEVGFRDEALSYLRDPELNHDLFFQQLSYHVENVRSRGYFNWKDLVAIAPNIEHFTIVGRPRMDSWNHTNTEHWRGANRETVAASTLCNSVPAFMLDSLLGSLRVTITNMTHDHTLIYTNAHAQSISEHANINVPAAVERVIERIKLEILPSITNFNIIPFTCTIDCSISGDIAVFISMDGQPLINYVVPTFADAMISPVVTNDYNHYLNVTNDVFRIGRELFNRQDKSNGIQPMHFDHTTGVVGSNIINIDVGNNPAPAQPTSSQPSNIWRL